MKMLLWVVATAMGTGTALAEVDIDRLCPPRPETAATFKAGAYLPAARPYREAAKMAYAYMTQLPAMTVLVETGRPNQKYQHNAYVSKTHAAHIEAMLNWMKFEPEKRETAMRFAKASAEFLLKELEPMDAKLAWWPPTYGRKPLEFDPKTDGPYHKPAMVGNEPEGAVKYRGEVMLLYPADVGMAFVDYYVETKDKRFLEAAAGIGSMLADIISGYAFYAPGTLVIKALMALAAGAIYKAVSRRSDNFAAAHVPGALASELIMVFGYCAYSGLLLGSGWGALASLPSNAAQGVLGMVGGLALAYALRRTGFKGVNFLAA